MKTIILFILLLISTLGSAQTVISDYKYRKTLYDAAYKSLYQDKNLEIAIFYFQELAKTDQDSLLIAAKAYKGISLVYGNDSINREIAENKQLDYIEQSIKKYPDNLDAYIDKLRFYKYSTSKKNEKELIKILQQKFSNSSEMYFELANYYILYDFLWQDAPNYKICEGYLKKAIELNPSEFNAMLLLAAAYKHNSKLRIKYLKIMYKIGFQQFIKKDAKLGEATTYSVSSIASKHLIGTLNIVLSSRECKILGIIK